MFIPAFNRNIVLQEINNLKLNKTAHSNDIPKRLLKSSNIFCQSLKFIATILTIAEKVDDLLRISIKQK